MGPILLASICLLAPKPAPGRTDQASEIRISSAWRGFGFDAPKDSLVRISRTPDGYVADGRPIDERLVSDLLAAVGEPPLERPSLENLGLSQEWLEQSGERSAREYDEAHTLAASPSQRALYLASFKSADLVETIVPSLFNGVPHTDDYPHVEVDISRADGSTVSLLSTSQHLFMLPWEVRARGRSVKTYNARIGRAVARLVASGFQERARLAGDNLRPELTRRVRDHIREEWDRLDVVNRAGPALATLESTFTVGLPSINSFTGVDYGPAGEAGEPAAHFHARLRRADYPPGFSVGLALPFEGGRVVDLDVFERNLGRYQKLALSVPWLPEAMNQPGHFVVLRLVGSRSFGDKAMHVFEQDMTALGRMSLIERVKAHQSETCLLIIMHRHLRGYWLVLPDGQVVLWRFSGYDTLVRWEPDQFNSGPCANRNGDVCVGAVISPDGRVVER